MMFPSYALLGGIALFSSGAAAVTYQINVSNDTAGLIFDPSNITAAVGDVVSFTYHPKNHSVTQSSFAAPCTPLFGGFDTGFVPVANASITPLPTREFTVNDTNPIWIHCRQAANTAGSHCGKGMVFAVNPGLEGSNNSFAAFKAAALAIGTQLAGNSTNATTTTNSSTTPSTGSVSVSGSTATSTSGSGSKSNGAITLNVDGAMLMAGFGLVVSLMV